MVRDRVVLSVVDMDLLRGLEVMKEGGERWQNKHALGD